MCAVCVRVSEVCLVPREREHVPHRDAGAHSVPTFLCCALEENTHSFHVIAASKKKMPVPVKESEKSTRG